MTKLKKYFSKHNIIFNNKIFIRSSNSFVIVKLKLKWFVKKLCKKKDILW